MDLMCTECFKCWQDRWWIIAVPLLRILTDSSALVTGTNYSFSFQLWLVMQFRLHQLLLRIFFLLPYRNVYFKQFYLLPVLLYNLKKKKVVLAIKNKSELLWLPTFFCMQKYWSLYFVAVKIRCGILWISFCSLFWYKKRYVDSNVLIAPIVMCRQTNELYYTELINFVLRLHFTILSYV